MLKPRRLTAALKPDGGILPAKTRPGKGTGSGFGQMFVGAANDGSIAAELFSLRAALCPLFASGIGSGVTAVVGSKADLSRTSLNRHE